MRVLQYPAAELCRGLVVIQNPVVAIFLAMNENIQVKRIYLEIYLGKYV